MPVLALLLFALVACQAPAPASEPDTAAPLPDIPSKAGTPQHVFVINLENKGYDSVWGSNSPAPFLSGTLRRKGVLLMNYYGIAHNSLPNYLAQISGQQPNIDTEQDCRTYKEFNATGTGPEGTLQGNGCLYPEETQTLAGQLTAQGKTWKGYMEDMQQPCEHPVLGEPDNHGHALPNDMYSTHHDPFVYFRSITSSPDCTKNVVNFSALANDLKSVDTTPNLAYVTPNLCHDGHDSTCADGSRGGLGAVDSWLKAEVPAILSSPAFLQDGMLVITFDETDGGTVGPSEGDPGSPAGGSAGGRVGALVISPFSTAAASSDQPYNHYSLLATMEDLFHLPRLGLAADPGVKTFGSDVYQSGS
ncbi:alkaline phosphatase family protein [Arthrobacter sp. MMS24-T111]